MSGEAPFGGPSRARQLVLVVRDSAGGGERRVLDIAEMTTDATVVRSAACAARDGGTIDLGAGAVPVFDLRTPQLGPEDAGGCLLLGERGGVRVALLVD